VDGRGEKFRGDNDSTFQSGRSIVGQMMSRGDLPRVYLCVVKWRSESEGDSFDERLTATSPSWNSWYCFFYSRRRVSVFREMYNQRTGSSDCTTSLKIPPQKQQMINVKMRLKYLQNHILLAFLAIGTRWASEWERPLLVRHLCIDTRNNTYSSISTMK